MMRNLLLIGVVLVVLGIAGLIVQNVTFTETKQVLNVGPLQVSAEEQHNVPIPTIAGIHRGDCRSRDDFCRASLSYLSALATTYGGSSWLTFVVSDGACRYPRPWRFPKI